MPAKRLNLDWDPSFNDSLGHQKRFDFRAFGRLTSDNGQTGFGAGVRLGEQSIQLPTAAKNVRVSEDTRNPAGRSTYALRTANGRATKGI